MYKSAIAILAVLCVVSTTNAAAPARQRTKTVHKSVVTDEQYDPYMGISQHRRAMEEDHSMSMDHHDDHSMSMKDDDHEGHDHGDDDHSDDKEMVEEPSSACTFGTIGALALTGAVALL